MRSLAAALLLVSLSASATPRVDSLIRRLMKEGEVPGLSIVVIRSGKVDWERAYGFANADTRDPLTRRNVFESASLTKPVFAYAVLKLVDAGVIELDVPLQHYLPEPVTDERMKRITARMVLSHTTGFQNEVMPGQTLAVHFEPGSRFSYSGAGFLYLQRVVEHVTGKNLTPLMQELVFGPLGMHDSSYVWLPDYETREAYGHSPAGVVAARRKPSVGTIATLHTTPRDYARFIIALMKSDGRMFTPQIKLDESCFTCLTNPSGKMSASLSWGLGIALERGAFFHWGDNNAEFNNFAMGYRDSGNGVVIFTNSGNGFSIMPDIAGAVLPGEHPSFKWMGYEHYDSPAKAVLRDIRARGAAAGLQNPLVKNLTEPQINRIGYTLLALRRAADAILVFEHNVHRFPDSANVYDSLGEACAAAGDHDKAIVNYQRSLELDPKNTNAAEWLGKLRRGRL